jgi:hypothetical protein
MRFGGAIMAFGFEDSETRCEVPSARLDPDGSLAWYMVVGIELFLLAAILVPVVCGALFAR